MEFRMGVTCSGGSTGMGWGRNHAAKCRLKVKVLTFVWDDVLAGAYFVITNSQLNKIRPCRGQ